MARLKRYFLNLGPGWAIYNLAVLAYIIYNASSLSGPAAIVFIAVFLMGLLVPRLVIGLLVAHATPVLKACQTVFILCIVVLVLSYTGVLAMHPLAWLGTLFVIALVNGINFWVMSDQRILTHRGSERLQDLG